ncbi:rho GTPase-activating protein SYDE1 isoform X2 [Sphaerodactylus townsendi]|uniref:Uncharacterized protein n=1 Tax=Sphaerodactylus townsendi TaxID=933632 RepID=A0ACB8ET56_9SAUR|nr:rho GTPase-activating protein SYDE1 isoform X2 [Sphaerodactylus townsendi]
MAQPLLRKTLSRLRRKESRAAPKGRQEPGCPLEPAGASESSVAAVPENSCTTDAGCWKVAPVTVSRKQNWAKFEAGIPSRKSCFSSVPQGLVAQDEKPSSKSLSLTSVVTARSKEATETLMGSIEICSSNASVKCSSQGAYLQSLDRSSRDWVLSSGKAPGADEPAASSISERKASVATGSRKGEIWYNPIPEDEDLRPQYHEMTRGSSAGDKELQKKRFREAEVVQEWSSQQSSLSQTKPAMQAEEGSRQQDLACGKVPVTSASPEEGTTDTIMTVQSPSSTQKKDHLLGKTKSPGPVRSLSMKLRRLPELRRRLSLRSLRPRGPEAEGSSSPKESRNVISRYHLDSSVASRQHTSRGAAVSKEDSLRGGGGSPELLADDADLGLEGGSFQPYRSAELPGCLQHLSGVVSIHLLGVRDFKPPRAEAKEVFCVLQVDSVNKARTALLPCRTAFLSLNHSFQLELEHAQLLKIVISCDPSVQRDRVCCHGTILLPHVFQGGRSRQLAVQLQPRGLLYIKLILLDQRELASGIQEPQVFGVKLSQLVKRERAAAIKVPLLVQKCVNQIEKRGLKVVGLYRLCGSAVVKKELRDAFEKDSTAVVLSEELYPDINAITGILKDYLRELPMPLITSHLYQVVLEAMSKRAAGQEAEETVDLLDCLPEAEKATLRLLLDHLSLVAAFYAFNRMNAQNLAVCFGPVLLSQGPGRAGDPAFGSQHLTASSTVDFKHHIEVLHYLLQSWPAQHRNTEGDEPPLPRERRLCHLALDLPLEQPVVVVRSHSRGLESPPSNRYAGDWSICGQQLLPGPPRGSGDQGEVAGSGSDHEEDSEGVALRDGLTCRGQSIFLDNLALMEDAEAAFSRRISLKDFDALLLDLERELCKQINVCL